MSVENLPKVIKLLGGRQNISPSRIAREINSDRRTVEKVLKAGMDSGIIVLGSRLGRGSILLAVLIPISKSCIGRRVARDKHL